MVLNASYVCLHAFSLRRESPNPDPGRRTPTRATMAGLEPAAALEGPAERAHGGASSSASLIDRRVTSPRSTRCVGTALPRSRSTAAHPPIGGRALARRPAAAPLRGELRSVARREEAQMNPRVRVRVPTPFLFGRNPRVAVGCRWTAHV
jgi:hypothetical protein